MQSVKVFKILSIVLLYFIHKRAFLHTKKRERICTLALFIEMYASQYLYGRRTYPIDIVRCLRIPFAVLLAMLQP